MTRIKCCAAAVALRDLPSKQCTKTPPSRAEKTNAEMASNAARNVSAFSLDETSFTPRTPWYTNAPSCVSPGISSSAQFRTCVTPNETSVCLALASSAPPRKRPGAISGGRRVFAVSPITTAFSERRETRAQSSYRSTTSRPALRERDVSVTSRNAHEKEVEVAFTGKTSSSGVTCLRKCSGGIGRGAGAVVFARRL